MTGLAIPPTPSAEPHGTTNIANTTDTLTIDDLRRPTRDVARRVALAQLKRLSSAIAHSRADDPHSLHDVRVALRRLRVWLRAYRAGLRDTVPAHAERALHQIQAATNVARNREVQYQWFKKQHRRIRDDHKDQKDHSAPEDHGDQDDRTDHQEPHRVHDHGSRHVSRRVSRTLQRRSRMARTAAQVLLTRQLPRATAQLGDALAWYPMTLDTRPVAEQHPVEVSMGSTTRHVIASAERRLQRRVARIKSPKDTAHMHRARLAAKRLRYLLEPLREVFPTAARTVTQLAALQDRMGEIHDATLMRADLSRRDTSSGLRHDMRRRLRTAREQYDTLDIPATTARIGADVHEIVTQLRQVETI